MAQVTTEKGLGFRVGVRTNTDGAHDFALRGRYKKAAVVLKRVVRIRETVQGTEHRATLMSTVEYGTMLAADGCADEAVRIIENVLDRLLSGFGADDPVVADTAYTLKYLYPLIGVYSGGTGPWAQAVDDVTIPPTADELLEHQIWSGYHHAVALRNADDLARAQIVLSNKRVLIDQDHRVYAAAHRIDEEGHTAYRRMAAYARDRTPALTEADAAAVSFSSPRSSAEAEAADPLDVWADVLAWHVTYRGVDHPATLECRFEYARRLLLAGRREAAVTEYESVLDRRRATLRSRHPDVLAAVVPLADVYCEQDRYAEAEALARPALEARRAESGDAHRDSLRLAFILAQALVAQAKTAEADPLIALLRRYGYEVELEESEPSPPPDR